MKRQGHQKEDDREEKEVQRRIRIEAFMYAITNAVALFMLYFFDTAWICFIILAFAVFCIYRVLS